MQVKGVKGSREGGARTRAALSLQCTLSPWVPQACFLEELPLPGAGGGGGCFCSQLSPPCTRQAGTQQALAERQALGPRSPWAEHLWDVTPGQPWLPVFFLLTVDNPLTTHKPCLHGSRAMPGHSSLHVAGDMGPSSGGGAPAAPLALGSGCPWVFWLLGTSVPVGSEPQFINE